MAVVAASTAGTPPQPPTPPGREASSPNACDGVRVAAPCRAREARAGRRARMGGMRIVVVGGGVMGLATAWQLTRRGERPIVVERFARGHHEGASHGETRNDNNAYGDAHYLDLLALAREGWDALGEVDGEPLLRRHGLVSHGPGPALGAANRAPLAELADALTARGIPADLLDGAEAARRWPGMRFESTVLYSRDAGVARAAAALRELERRTVAAGGEVRGNTRVAAIAPDADGVDVVTDAGVLRADVVVATVGAWTEKLLGASGDAGPAATGGGVTRGGGLGIQPCWRDAG
ncbi:FAD-dependent oxidoreductase [Microbacterium lacticum]